MATFLSNFTNLKVWKLSRFSTELKGNLRRLTKRYEKIENFMGFCELSEEELKMIDKDIEACEMGELELIDLEDAKRILNV